MKKNSLIESICKLVEKNAAGEVLVLPCIRYCEEYGYQVITWDQKYGICARLCHTKEEAEKKLAIEVGRNGRT